VHVGCQQKPLHSEENYMKMKEQQYVEGDYEPGVE
jgi:hypothetical protein